MNQRYVITGAPGTGKTAIINTIKERGYSCVDENSREIIAEQIINGGEILPWKNQIAFENLISSKRAKQYASIPKNEIYFFDRSAIDCIAYLKANNLETSTEILEAIKNYEFNSNVFYTPIWEEIYTNDSERKESIESAIAIEKSLLETYNFFEYTLIEIPKLTTGERVSFILSKI
jgi:predicted ATPase